MKPDELDEIVSIEYIGEQETIDINVSGNKLFYANDLLTHNSAVEEVDFDHSMIAGGLSKINTADNVFGIFTSRSMREHGRYQLQLMKTRSSAGVGQKVELAFDIDTMRIVDTGDEDQQPASGPPPSTAIMNKIKKRQGETIDEETGEIMQSDNIPKVEAQGAQLKKMLAGLKNKNG